MTFIPKRAAPKWFLHFRGIMMIAAFARLYMGCLVAIGTRLLQLALLQQLLVDIDSRLEKRLPFIKAPSGVLGRSMPPNLILGYSFDLIPDTMMSMHVVFGLELVFFPRFSRR